MKLYKNRIKKFVTALLTIVVILNTILSSKYNAVRATQEAENNVSSEEIEIKEMGTFHKENINSVIYYVQRFSISSEKEGDNYNISINNFPVDTKILDENNNEISNLETKNFKIAIPHSNIKEDINCIIKVNNTEYEFKKNTNISIITTKVVYKNGIPKTNTKIELKSGENLIASALTDSNGIIDFKGLYPGRYSIYEKDVNGNIVGTQAIVLDLLYEEQLNINVLNDVLDGSNIIVENEKKKGTVEVHLINGDYEDIILENSEIEIYDFENNLIETMKTNEKGIATSSRLAIDNIYKVKQKNTWQDYIADFGMHEVRFKENDEVVVVEIINYIKKNFIKITKVDKDNNDIKLKGVVFGIYNSNDELIEEITTDVNGEAISSNLPVNKPYYVKEIKTLDNYVLDNKTFTIFLTETDKETGEISIDRLSSISNCLIIENQKMYNTLPKFGC